MDNITFTGMQNIGVVWKFDKLNPGAVVDRIAIQVNNNGHRDLDEFKQLLKTHNDCFHSNCLDIIFDSSPNRINPKRPYLDVFVNMKKLEMNTENMPVITKIENLLKRISKGEEEMPITEGYLNSETCLGRFFAEVYGNEDGTPKESLLYDLHDLDLVKAMVDRTSETLSKNIKNFYRFGAKDIYKDVKSVGGFSYETPFRTTDRLYLELKSDDMKIFKDFFLRNNPFSGIPQKLLIDVEEKGETLQKTISLNNTALKIEPANFPLIRKIVQTLNQIKETDKELPFPKDYLSDESFDQISRGVLNKKGEFKKKYDMSFEEKLESAEEFELDMITHDNGIKNLADGIIKVIDKKMQDYFK